MQQTPVVIDNVFTIEEILIPDQQLDNVIDDTKAEAADIIAQAKITAEQCIQEAQQQAIMIKQQAQAEGHQQGYEEGSKAGHDAGYQTGYQEGLLQGQQLGRSEMDQEIAEAVAKTKQILAAGEEEAKKMMLDAERQIVDIALAVARKIIAYEIAENPLVVLPLVKAALEKVSDQEEVVIRVSVDDFDSVLMAKNDLQTMVGRENALKITVDHTIQSGSCIIDTSYGEVDATVDTQFETIKKALQGVA